MASSKTMAAMAFAAAALAACSSMPGTGEPQRRADYEAAAGPPQPSFRFFSDLWSWEPLGRDLVVVYTRPSQAWLLDLDGPCQNLPFTQAIGLTSSSGTVFSRFDKVLGLTRERIERVYRGKTAAASGSNGRVSLPVSATAAG